MTQRRLWHIFLGTCLACLASGALTIAIIGDRLNDTVYSFAWYGWLTACVCCWSGVGCAVAVAFLIHRVQEKASSVDAARISAEMDSSFKPGCSNGETLLVQMLLGIGAPAYWGIADGYEFLIIGGPIIFMMAGALHAALMASTAGDMAKGFRGFFIGPRG